MKLEITTTEEQDEGIALAAESYNVEQKRVWDAAEAQKSVDKRVEYTPVTDQEYAEMRIGDVLNSYAQQKKDSVKVEVEKIIKVASKAELAAIFAAVDAVTVVGKPVKSGKN